MAGSKTKYELAESHEAIDLVPTWEPEWWWIALPAGLLVLLTILGYVLFKTTRAKDVGNAKREAFQRALAELAKLDPSLGKENILMVSLAMRKYLAESMNEPALYETHEEFIGRHDAVRHLNEELRISITNYFSELAAMKYGPAENRTFDPEDLKQRSVKLLERIHAS